MRNRHDPIRTCLPVLMAFALAACGSNAPDSDEAREKQLEDYAAAHGVDADVSIDGDETSVTVNQETGAGKAQVGNDLALPEGFPDDVAMFPGMRIISAVENPMGYIIGGQTDAASSDVAEFYAKTMTGGGWSLSNETKTPPVHLLVFDKGARKVSINLMSTENVTNVQVSALTIG